MLNISHLPISNNNFLSLIALKYHSDEYEIHQSILEVFKSETLQNGLLVLMDIQPVMRAKLQQGLAVHLVRPLCYIPNLRVTDVVTQLPLKC